MAALSSGICIPSNVTSKDCVCIFAFGHNSFGQIKLNGIPKINRPTLIKERLGDGSSQDIHGTWRFTLFAREDRVLVLGSVEPSEKHQVKTVKLPWTMKKILLSPNQSQLVGLTSENRLALSEETNLTSRLTMHNNSTKYEAIWRTHDGVLAQESFDHYCMLAFLGSISSVQFPLDKGAVVTHVSCGHCHSLMLTADRSVYAYGIGKSLSSLILLYYLNCKQNNIASQCHINIQTNASMIISTQNNNNNNKQLRSSRYNDSLIGL